ncbi:MAG: Unknown protein [uncultured Sulfurovum sp.]|uniref:Uncharacterized protein n=1 Tax=uncultured Sulfurovum sp. TaxID=269237 RepID=A0A6S6U0Q7_9BACT|nr:MAG: Unknown protein [uncultured Sulfurovum sp.]
MRKTIMIVSALAIIPVASFASSFKLVNDSGSKLSIHTGTGVANLNKGSSTSITCKVGKKIYTADRGTKDKFIFKVNSSHCGKTVKLSSVM